ncbi:large ribosomal subunit protein mL41 [Halyomorpha halys]|uniref:large ribosomal subunit protein mL41 n=1 Tax=Halyomorpha halys TaxID=286706 RepID=UPI0006D51D98|nr:39S ribosomal protein L41, mitochondrial [Halyomorpha halys]
MMEAFYIPVRNICTTSCLNGKRNFRKFIIPRRGSNIFKQRQLTNPDPAIPPYKSGVREPGYKVGDKFVTIPERIPELVVPDLTDFKLKPYVSYRAPNVVQSEFTAEDLFSAVYTTKIKQDFESGKLDENGNSLEPNENESLTPNEAWIRARQTGSDIFTERSLREEEEKYD